MKNVIFMPYDPSENLYQQIKIEYGGGEMHKNKKVKEFLSSKGHTVEVAWYDGKKNSHVSSLNNGAIYIRGHGMAGEGVIKGLKGGGETVSYETVCARLLKSGLPKSYSGEIHAYNCHSAEHSTQARSVFFGEPYAVRFANHMFSKGFRACTYYGYLGPLDSFPKPGSQGTTIYSREKTVQQVDGKSKLVLEERGTWDQARVTIHPTVEKRTIGQRVKSAFGR